MYKCRQVKCPLCAHIFMWIEYADLPPSYKVYRKKGSDEELGSTYCPQCNCEMVVPGNSLAGVAVSSEDVILLDTMRGV